MRAIPNAVTALVAGGLLLFSSQTAEACHGRKNCSLCAAKASGGWGGYSCYAMPYGGGYGYGGGAGYMPNYGSSNYSYSPGYSYPYSLPYAGNCYGGSQRKNGDGTESTTSGRTSPEVLDRLTKLENRLEVYDNRASEKWNNLDGRLAALQKTADDKFKALDDTVGRLNTQVTGLSASTEAGLARIENLVKTLQSPKPTDQQPPKPTDQQPPKPTDQQPPKPTDQQPPKPTDQQPAKPTDQQPAKPTDQQPPKPATTTVDDTKNASVLANANEIVAGQEAAKAQKDSDAIVTAAVNANNEANLKDAAAKSAVDPADKTAKEKAADAAKAHSDALTTAAENAKKNAEEKANAHKAAKQDAAEKAEAHKKAKEAADNAKK